jgi:transglutaminase-like putative cysteine protease
VQAPDVTLRDRQGDCDDQAVLIGALLTSIGHPVRFVAVGFRPGQFAHVYAETPIGPNWVAVETTENWPVGRAPRGVSHMVQKV